MNKIYPIFLSLFMIGCVSQTKYDDSLKEIQILQEQNDSLRSICDKKQEVIESLRDSVKILSFPANQRYFQATNLINEGKLDMAREMISDLMLIFPNSDEANKCKDLLQIIEKKEAQAAAELEKLKALGYKAFSDNSVVKVGDVTYSFSGFSFGRTFTYDYCDDVNEYSYTNADKNNTYILSSVAVSTRSNYASSPTIIACKIVNGSLKRLGYFRSEYATWISYGAKIGNYRDDTHDFSKVNTVRYKLGNEISLEDSKKPIVIIIPKQGESFKDESDIEYVKEHYNVVKIINRNKI